MATIKELREQAANAATEARTLLNQVEGEKDEARQADLETQHDKAMADYDKFTARADRQEKQDKTDRDIEAREEREEIESRKKKRPDNTNVDTPNDGEMTYRQAFHEYVKAEGQKGDMSAEARAVLAKGEHRAQTTTNAAGGYTVPEEMMGIIVKSMAAWGPMYDPTVTTEIVTTGGNAMPFPTVDDTASTAGTHTEGATMTDDGGKDVTFGEKTLEAYEFDTEWLRVSKALSDDSIFAMESLIGGLLGERLGRLANTQLTTGSGSSAPNGIVTASSLGETAASATAITFDEIIELEHSVDPAYRNGPNVRYMMHDGILKEVRKLKDGDGNYLWQMGNVQAGIPSTINGRPYSINQAMQATIATATRTMVFGDFSKYYVRKVGQPLIGALQDKDFWPGFGVAGYIRFDGELADTAAIKHLIQA